MNEITDDVLVHFGTPRHSGRYPWGSGENPYQNTNDFLGRIETLRKQGVKDKDIAKDFGLSMSRFRSQESLAKNERKMDLIATVNSLKEDGLGATEIGRKLNMSESTVRSLLDHKAQARTKQATALADFLMDQVDAKGMIDVGKSVELEVSDLMGLGVTSTRLETALEACRLCGYEIHGGRVPQVNNPGQTTTLKVLCPPGTEHKEIYNYDKINTLSDYISYDGGETFKPSFVYPASMDSKRLKIRYAEDGGTQKDGIIELRRGVEDLSLGKSLYSQVRILVDGDRYLKGMAVYSDDMPDGIDVIFNTNKSKDKSMREVLKEISNDPENPFGSLIKEHGGQSYYIDKDGNEKLSLINKRADAGDWGEWSKELPSQFLSKQPVSLIKKQLNLSTADKQAEFEEICALTNPTVKKKLLEDFADDCDASAVHLQARSLPGTRYQVILPIPSLKDNQVYAPNYDDGTQVALVRYPHGGLFEIPILTVNNKHAEAKRILGTTPQDAVGINAKVAERLSGADFDGDTVMVIPTHGKTGVKIATKPALEGLKNFDNKLEYGHTSKKVDPDGTEHYYRNDIEYKVMPKSRTGNEMGMISNLITDMTLRGATDDELAKAVRHSMVVIDAAKHKLDYRQSEKDNDIAYLKKKYQGHIGDDGKYHEGAGTLISRAKSPLDVPKRKGTPYKNVKGKDYYDPTKPEGALLYKEDPDRFYKQAYNKTLKKWVSAHDRADGVYYKDADGKYVKADDSVKVRVRERTQSSTKMMETDDAYKLVSDAKRPQEMLYADYANKMKALANQARKEYTTSGKIQYSKAAAQTYETEVNSLKAHLNIALKNSPRERSAQLIANSRVKAMKEDNPGMTREEEKKAGQRALTSARASVGAKRYKIPITDREWEAIQAGAIHESKLMEILRYADMDDVRERATPRATTTVTPAKASRMSSMKAQGYTTAQIANALGVSTSTVSRYLNGKE